MSLVCEWTAKRARVWSGAAAAAAAAVAAVSWRGCRYPHDGGSGALGSF